MVAKISRGASLYGAVIYNHEKVNVGTARIISANRMMSDITGNPENIIQQTLVSFESYLSANRNTRKPVLHISLNPSLSDRLSDEQFALLAKNYMEKMNYGDQPYIVYVHEDIDRRHIHIVSVCIDETGRKINDSYEHRRSMTACRELEISYGLEKITNEHKETDRLFLKKVDYQKGDVKHQVANVLKCVSQYKYRTFGEYSALLFLFNVEAKIVRGEGASGKPFNGIVYAATDDSGKVISNPFKSSLFGKTFGYETLNKQMKRHEKDLKEGKYTPLIRNDIATAIKTSSGERKKFISLLMNMGIGVVFRENAEGRIYGVTFIDHRRKEVYNGSALGKEFSANAFHKLFNETGQGQNKTTEVHSNRSYDAFSSTEKETALEQIFGLFDFPAFTDERDYEEEALQRQVKRRKKTKKRRLSL